MPVQHALERLGRPPGEAVFVGDSPHDVAAGNAAGTVTVAALWGACDRECLSRATPTHFLEDIGALPGLVARLRGPER
jgi:pyrophosphatase PpaX